MTRKPWFWFLIGWLASLAFSPTHVTAIFGRKASS
jgi:hypothetical protein